MTHTMDRTLPFTNDDHAFFKTLLVDAGTAALDFQKKGDIIINRKDDRSIVTQADLMVQDLLMTRIASRYPDFHFVMEENNGGAEKAISDDTISAVIDPIDGTAMFSMRLPEWCVSVGIFKGYAPVYGFVYSPGFDMFFYNDDQQSYLNDRPVQAVLDIPIDNETNIFNASEVQNHFHIDFPGKIRNLGSTALHGCLTIDNARNRTLAFIGRSHLWDWAGAIPIIKKAGGGVKYISGREIDFRAVIDNNYRLLDFVIVYNSTDFGSVKRLFKPLPFPSR